MLTQYYKINNRNYSMVKLTEHDELQLNPEKNYLFELSYLSIINVIGKRAQEFLQGQLSCNLNFVNTSSMRQGALCNLKGRVQALMDVINWQKYQLVLPKDLITSTIAMLNTAAMVSRVALQEEHDYKIYGFYLSNPDALLPENFNLAEISSIYTIRSNTDNCTYHIGDNYYLIIFSKKQFMSTVEYFAKADCLRGSLVWHKLQLARLRVEIYPETCKEFLPHRLNLHNLGYLDFNKGCYRGQEIIARTHYLAKLKYSLKTFIVDSVENIIAGQKIIDLEHVQIGELIDYCPIEVNKYIITASLLLQHSQQVLFAGHNMPCILQDFNKDFI